MIELLLIDDDEDDRYFFQLALEKIDATICCKIAKSGREALEILKGKEVSPDIIFLDLNMPQMDGRECLKELKKNAATWHIPVVIFSTSSEYQDIEYTKKLGATDFVTKPSKLNELSHILNDIVIQHLKKLTNQSI